MEVTYKSNGRVVYKGKDFLYETEKYELILGVVNEEPYVMKLIQDQISSQMLSAGGIRCMVSELWDFFIMVLDPDARKYCGMSLNRRIYAYYDTHALFSQVSVEMCMKVDMGGEYAIAYKFPGIDQAFVFDLWMMLREKLIIRKCKHCGKYFIATRTDNVYCTNIAPGSTTPCIVAGPKKVYSDHIRQQGGSRLIYAKVYRRLQARVRRGKMTKEDFRAWIAEAKTRIKDVDSGAWTEEQFAEWIDAS